MRRLTFSALALAALLVVYGISPIAAWLGLLGSSAFVLTRRARASALRPARIER